MAKNKTAFVCTECGYDSPKWAGRCPACGQWNTFKEINLGNNTTSPNKPNKKSEVTLLRDIPTDKTPRIILPDDELNRVLGGGLVQGSIVLLGGEPGIGKSTLTLQTLLRMSPHKALYISGEESAAQLKMRADRITGGDGGNIDVLCETSLENIISYAEQHHYEVIIIDSIQTIATDSADSIAGSISQVRQCAAQLLQFAKTSGTPIIIIGHINKEGTLAGPKILEHIVDAVIQFEGDQNNTHRILRAIKNRFGSTAELGIYEMRGDGLRQVSNPSELLLTRNGEGLSGIAITSAIEGVRPFLVETQALVSTAAYGTPQRASTGFDQRRLNMLLAVLEKRVGFKIMQKDVFVNIAGGLRITDMAMDLSIIAAVLSSNVDTPIPTDWCMAGEVGLSGEIRPISRINQRIAEAEKLGFHHIIIPQNNLKTIEGKFKHIEIHPANKVETALQLLFG